MIFRHATIADIPAMSEIRLTVKENVLMNPDRVTYQMYVDYLDELGRGWVCEIDGLIVGFSYAAKDDASIWALFVRQEYEGRGIGKKLLQFATDWLFCLGKDTITLSTSIHTRAEKFYEAQGWKRGEMKYQGEVYFSLSRPSTETPL